MKGLFPSLMEAITLHHSRELASLKASWCTFSPICLCSILYLAFHVGLHYHTVMERHLENRKKLMLVRMMNSVNLYSKNIMNNDGIFNDDITISSNYKEEYWDEQCFLRIFLGWTTLPEHSSGNMNPPKISNLVWIYEILNEYLHFFSRTHIT